MFNTDSFKIQGKYFSENTESDGYVKNFAKTDLIITEFEEAGVYYAQMNNYEEFGSPEYILLNKYNNDKNTVIFIMDSHSFRKAKNYEKMAALLLNKNIIIIHQPGTENISSYSEICRDIDKFINAKVITVKLLDMIVRKIRETSSKRLIVAGAGDGGWIVNLHTALCGGQVTYAPFFTGSGTGDLLFNSSVKNQIAPEAKKKQIALINLLNFDDIYMSNSRLARIFPVLSENDEYNNLMRQKTSYQDADIRITKKSYSSSIHDQKLFADHINSLIDRR